MPSGALPQPGDIRFEQLRLQRREPDALWVELCPVGRPVINRGILDELNLLPAVVHRYAYDGKPVAHVVLHSRREGVFSLGGDLDLFKQLIETRDVEGLRAYGHACINIVHAAVRGFGEYLMTYALVQGDALGGGMETALTADFIVMEEQARMGLPEVLFNLFPGMGGPSLLVRKLGDYAAAQKLIESGRLYSAQELHALGLCHVVAPQYEGAKALQALILEHDELREARIAARRARQMVHPMGKDELKEVVEIWVESALRLTPRDLRLMGRLVRRQHAI